MRKTGPQSGLYRTLPAIRAEVSTPHGRFPRGSVVWLVDPHATQGCEEVFCVGRSVLGMPIDGHIPWRILQHVEPGRGASAMVAQCWRGTQEEMEDLVDRIASDHGSNDVDFSLGFEV